MILQANTRQSLTYPPSNAGIVLVVADTRQLVDELRSVYLTWLDADESARYARIKHPQNADCFLLSRAIVRQVIAEFVDTAPDKVILTLSPKGKPLLAADLKKPRVAKTGEIYFSITHKLTAVAVAFAVGPVGVDLEPVDEKDKAAIARRFFTAQEADHLLSLEPLERSQQFTKIWVLKEALIKREGSTLAEWIGKVAFHVDGHRIRCHGYFAQGCYSLYRIKLDEKPGYLGMATSSDAGKELICYRGLPLSGYVRRPLALAANS